jgi:hypothetical protein
LAHHLYQNRHHTFNDHSSDTKYISVLFGLKILNAANSYYLPFVGVLFGFSLGSIGRIKSVNQLTKMYDKISILFLFLFVILLSFLMINLALRIITDFRLILILFFIDFAFGVLFSAQYADRKSQLKKEHPS